MKCPYCGNDNHNQVVVKEHIGTYLGIGIVSTFTLIAIFVLIYFRVTLFTNLTHLIVSLSLILVGIVLGLLCSYYLDKTYLFTICSKCGNVVNKVKKSSH